MDALTALAATPRLNRLYFDLLAPGLSGDVLEVGAGIGNMSALIADACSSLCVTDMDESHVRRLRERFAARPEVTALHFELGEAVPDAIAERRFDAVISFNVIEHVEDDADAVRTLAERLAEGGRLLTYVPAGDWAYGSLDRHLLHYRRYDLDRFRRLMEGAGLTVETLRYVNVLGLGGWLVNGLVLRRRSLSARQTKVFDRLVPLVRRLEPEAPPLGLGLICRARR